MLDAFPKTRPSLPPEYKAVYERQYLENRQGDTRAASLSQRMETWLHRQVAADAGGAPKTTLEIGAGTLNQLPYEPKSAPYDIVEPMAFLYENSPHRNRIRRAYRSLADVPLEERYDRIISCAALEHICELPEVVARSALLLSSGGSFRASIPSEGGFLWKLGWSLTTGLEFRLRHGLDYGVLMRHEHVNTAAEIEAVTRHFFRKVRVRSFGLGGQLSLYRFIEASAPDTDVARRYLVECCAKEEARELSGGPTS